MRHLASIVFILAASLLLAQDREPTTTFQYEYDRATEVYEEKYRVENSFDANGNLISSEVYVRMNGIETCVEETQFTFDKDGRLQYYEKGFLMGDNMVWGEKMTITRDGQGRLINELYQERSSNEDDWINKTQIQATWQNGRKASQVVQNWTEGSWSNAIKTEYVYNEDGQVEEERVGMWMSASFEPSSRNRYEYNDEGQNTALYTEAFYSGSYNPFSRDIIESTETGNSEQPTRKRVETQLWKNSLLDYHPTLRILIFMDVRGDKTSAIWADNMANVAGQAAKVSTDTLWVPTWKEIYEYAPSTAIEEQRQLPQSFTMKQNYPNPFNPRTAIQFTLVQSSSIRLEVFDALGRRVALLEDGLKPAGQHRYCFDARDLPSGLYLCRLSTAGGSVTRKMQLIK